MWSISWSPDGSKLAAAFSHLGNGGVVIADRSKRVYIGQEDWEGKHITKLVNVNPMSTIHNSWYHTGAGSPRSIARLFSGVSFSPDGQSLVYCSNQPPILSSSQAADWFAQTRDAKETEISALEDEKRKGRDATREAAQALFGEAQSVRSFQLYTINIDGGDSEGVPGTNTAWPVVTKWGDR